MLSSWVNQQTKWSCSSSQTVKLPEGTWLILSHLRPSSHFAGNTGNMPHVCC